MSSCSSVVPLADPGTIMASTAAALSPASAPLPQRSVGLERQNLNFMVGQKELSADQWDPNDGQVAYGLLFDYYRVDQWVGLDAGLLYSTDSSDQGIGQTTELFVGARKTFTFRETLHPYVAAGLAYVWGTNGVDAGALVNGLDEFVIADQGDSLGLYLRGGVYATFSEHINIGLDLRTTQATSFDGGLNSAGIQLTEDANSFQVSMTVGWGF